MMLASLARSAAPGARRLLSDSATAGGSAVWRTGFAAVPNTPKGFTVRTAFAPGQNPDGATTLLERWEAGTSEPPHSHPGDDMTVVVEGRMAVQFFTRTAGGALVRDGEPLVLQRGEVGFIAAGRIHDAKYLEACKLVYVHDKEFGFREHK
eukprot:TRINITY_DN4616_c0_g1_i11.p1 TRINITY_DN4616_c0_g1~~TRINITY_DN4616_c0_g1_i11.p1  ORF type:complete len:151 (-),score=39.94 TRINITY_DN4616_c0_g1_i11:36-488(-)